MIEYGASLLRSDARKPVNKLRHKRAILKVLKQRGDGYTCTSEHPSPADAFWISFDCWTS
jgi:hypothetical protein